jgi:hypothetical protein
MSVRPIYTRLKVPISLGDLDRRVRNPQTEHNHRDHDDANEHRRILIAASLVRLHLREVDTLRCELQLPIALLVELDDLGSCVLRVVFDRPAGGSGQPDKGGVLSFTPLFDLGR